jgi:arsenate reductase
MKKVYYLATCSTCIRILKELDSVLTDFKLQDIKTEKMSSDEIDQMKSLSGSFESLFSRRAMKYKSMGLASQDLQEEDYKKLILDEYTFLKRPVFVIRDKIFIGNSAKVVEAVKAELS